MSKGLINLATYSRPELLEKCLHSIAGAKNSKNYPKLIVLQRGNPDVLSLVYNFADNNTQIMEVDGESRSPLQNINFNRWLSWKVGFDELGYDWILSVEEDIVLHADSLLFIEYIYAQYLNNKRFRGINLGSKLSDSSYLGTFSELRYGLHGCGAVITNKTWNMFSRLHVGNKLDSDPLDSLIEPILKTGFMVTPNLSFIEDFGWHKGTHTSPNSNDPHYVEVRNSFEINKTPNAKTIRHYSVQPNWRSDCILYEKRQNVYFDFILLITPLLNSRSLKILYLLIRKIGRKLRDYKRASED